MIDTVFDKWLLQVTYRKMNSLIVVKQSEADILFIALWWMCFYVLHCNIGLFVSQFTFIDYYLRKNLANVIISNDRAEGRKRISSFRFILMERPSIVNINAVSETQGILISQFPLLFHMQTFINLENNVY